MKLIIPKAPHNGWSPGAVDHMAGIEVEIEADVEIKHAKAHPWYREHCWMCKVLKESTVG